MPYHYYYYWYYHYVGVGNWIGLKWLNFLRFCVNKTPQTSITFRRILAEYTTVVFCNSTILFSIPMSLDDCFNFFGVVPNAPTNIGITLTGIFHIFFNSRYRSLQPFILSFSLSSIVLSKGHSKSMVFALIFGLIYYYDIRSSCLNEMISLYYKIP